MYTLQPLNGIMFVICAGVDETLQAADHDFNCDSITPSVKLVVVPPATEESTTASAYYDGDVYIHLKDATLQASTPLRHAAETLQTIKKAGHLHSKVLVIRTDGGPDRKNTYIKVQLAFLALAIHLDLDALILMRTTPGQSYVNPVERCMSAVNLALIGMALARASSGAATEAALKNQNSMNKRRTALKLADGVATGKPHTSAFAKSMQARSALLHKCSVGAAHASTTARVISQI